MLHVDSQQKLLKMTRVRTDAREQFEIASLPSSHLKNGPESEVRFEAKTTMPYGTPWILPFYSTNCQHPCKTVLFLLIEFSHCSEYTTMA